MFTWWNRLSDRWQASRHRLRVRVLFAAVLFGNLLSGCAAFTNPVASGIPVRRLPPELLGTPKEDMETIPLTLLRQKPQIYRLAPGDVLGVWIEPGVFSQELDPLTKQARPMPPPALFSQDAALGYPIPVLDNGTVLLPLVEPIEVQGLTIPEATEAIREAYTKNKRIIQPGQERIIVTLLRPRAYHVLVIRQDSSFVAGDSGGYSSGIRGVLGGSSGGSGGSVKRGSGSAIDLPAYENDVLHALARTGGLPGLDAINEVVILRGYYKPDRDLLIDEMQALPPGQKIDWEALGVQVIRIPLRLMPGQQPPFAPEDVVLQTGDIVFIEARDTELYYTAGLLPIGEFVLPRDYDLDVVEAVARINGPLINGGLNSNNVTGTLISSGLGNPSPSLLSVLRKTPNGGQVNIRVDLNQALRDPRERILVQAGDVLVLQETPGEAFARYATGVLNYNMFWQVFNRRDAAGVTTLSVP